MTCFFLKLDELNLKKKKREPEPLQKKNLEPEPQKVYGA